MYPSHQNASFHAPPNGSSNQLPPDMVNSTQMQSTFQHFQGNPPNSQSLNNMHFSRPPFPGPPPNFPMTRGPPPPFSMGPPPPQFIPTNQSQLVVSGNPNTVHPPPFQSNYGNQNPFQTQTGNQCQMPIMPPNHQASDQGNIGTSKGHLPFPPQFAKPPPGMLPHFQNPPPSNFSSDSSQGHYRNHSEFDVFSNEKMVQENRHTSEIFNLNKEQELVDDQKGDSEPSFDKYQREKDQYWIENWLKKNGKLKSMVKKKQFSGVPNDTKLYEVQQAFHQSIIFLAKLQHQCRSLETTTSSADTQTWEAEKNLTEEYKDKCVELHQFLNNGEMLHHIKQKIENRKKKRARMRRRKREAYEEREAERERRETTHRQLDDWKNQMAQLAEDEKQKAELKKSADSTLSSVRKKIADAKKTQEFLKAFQKLRKIRRVAAINQGRYASDTYDINFEKKMEELSKLMTSQQKVYESEEKTLRVMLDAVEEETRERDKEIKLQKERARERREKKLNLEKLFGKKTVIPEDDDLYPFYSYYTQAEQSAEALIQIRHDWDMHLVLPNVSAGSRIPDGFILPAEPSSDVWASALK